MVEIRKVAASEAVGKVDTEIEWEKEHIFLLLLLLGVHSRDCHIQGGQWHLFEEHHSGVGSFAVGWGWANRGHTRGSS
jgi:hypothetical protein